VNPALTCNFNLPTVNGDGTSTLTVASTANHAALMHSSSIFYAMLLPIGGMTLLGAGLAGRKKMLGICLACLVIFSFVFMTACGGGSSNNGGGGNPSGGTPAGTYTITVSATASSGGVNIAKTANVTLTVQ